MEGKQPHTNICRHGSSPNKKPGHTQFKRTANLSVRLASEQPLINSRQSVTLTGLWETVWPRWYSENTTARTAVALLSTPELRKPRYNTAYKLECTGSLNTFWNKPPYNQWRILYTRSCATNRKPHYTGTKYHCWKWNCSANNYVDSEC
jgi:hypothetical protein